MVAVVSTKEWTNQPWPLTITICWASLATPARMRSRSPIASWPASCIPTPTRTTLRLRPSSKRCRRPTPRCLTPRSGQPMTVTARPGSVVRDTTRSKDLGRSTTSSRPSLVARVPSVAELAARCRSDVDRLDVGVQRLVNPHRYHVSVTDALHRLRADLLARLDDQEASRAP